MSALFSLIVAVLINEKYKEDPGGGKCLCLCHWDQESKEERDVQYRRRFKAAPLKGKLKEQLTDSSSARLEQLGKQRSDDTIKNEDQNGVSDVSEYLSGTEPQTEVEGLTPPKGVPCQFCDKIFVSSSTLLKHQSKHHPETGALISDKETTFAKVAVDSKSIQISGKEPIILQNEDGTSVITVPPDFWKDDISEKRSESYENDDDDGKAIIDDEEDKSEEFDCLTDDKIADEEEDVINSVRDVMNDFIVDRGNIKITECPNSNESRRKQCKEDNGEYSKLIKENRRRKRNDAEDKLVLKKAKYEECSVTTRESPARRKKVAEEVIEIDSESEEDCAHESSTVSISSQSGSDDKLTQSDSSFRYMSTSAMLFASNKVDKNIQTIPTNKLSTNTSKAGKLLGCSGKFQPAKVNYASKSLLARVIGNTRSTQTGKKYPYSGKVLYPSTDSPSKQNDNEPIYDCTFHKYCIVNKTKFHTKDQLTRHIVTGFRNQPHVATERRPPITYCQRKKDQGPLSVTGQQKTNSTDTEVSTSGGSEHLNDSEVEKLISSVDGDKKFYTKEELGKQIVSGLVSPDGDTKSCGLNEFDCPVCTNKFSTPQSLYEHIQSNHAQVMVSNTPSGSDIRKRESQSRNQRARDKVKNRPKSLVTDLSTVVGTKAGTEVPGERMFLSTTELTEIVYPCPVCRAIFYHDFELESHIKSQHKTDDQNSDGESDSEEMESDHNPVTRLVKSVVSSKCRNLAGDEGDDEPNEATSTSSGPEASQDSMARCPICPTNLAVFGTVTDLQLHLTETHGVQAKVVNLADKKSADSSMSKYGGHYECPVCALLFSTSSDMYVHLNSAHIKQANSLRRRAKKQRKVKPDEANSGK